jgi:hypothetical protein
MTAKTANGKSRSLRDDNKKDWQKIPTDDNKKRPATTMDRITTARPKKN